MKTSLDPRHRKRQQIIQELFSTEFHDQKVSEGAADVLKHKEEIDALIQKAAPEYPVDKINRVDLAILRLAVYELVFVTKAPANVIIDEAVELAKEFANDTSPGFINGVLGNISVQGKVTKGKTK